MADNFVKRRRIASHLGKSTSLKRGTGGINPCYRPSAGSSKADLKEFHAEDLKLRRAKQRSRQPNVGHKHSGSIATGNRNLIRIARTGLEATRNLHRPHEHKREIARAQRRCA